MKRAAQQRSGVGGTRDDALEPAREGLVTRESFVRDTVAWINRRLLHGRATIDATAPLFADGLIDSILILRVIAWTEHALGVRIDDAQIRMDNFATVERIADVFIPEVTHA